MARLEKRPLEENGERIDKFVEQIESKDEWNEQQIGRRGFELNEIIYPENDITQKECAEEDGEIEGIQMVVDVEQDDVERVGDQKGADDQREDGKGLTGRSRGFCGCGIFVLDRRNRQRRGFMMDG